MSISAYIKSNEQLKNMDFATVYCVIIELIADKRIEWDFGEDV